MSYDKYTWQTGETITAEKMNHIEDGIAEGGGSDDSLQYAADAGKNGAVVENAVLGAEIEINGSKSTVENSIANTASGNFSHAEGRGTTASSDMSHAEGGGTKASGSMSHAEGSGTTASGQNSHAEGVVTTAEGANSHAEGLFATASGGGSHAEGGSTTASGGYSHTEGYQSTASGDMSHAEGYGTKASGNSSHAEGYQSTASGLHSHAEGYDTIANHRSQHVFGEDNVADPSTATSNNRGNYIEIVGNGSANNSRSNARTLDWSGNESLQGSLTLGKDTADEVTLTAVQLKALLALLN